MNSRTVRDAMIFLATNIVNLNLETVNWSRAWVAEVGDQPTLLKATIGG